MVKITSRNIFTNPSKKLLNLILLRDLFIQAYCEERGWKKDRLNLDQIIEIRSQEDWKNPQKKGSYLLKLIE